ncbi:MAG: TonB-dependent receptor, partial [Bacteroidetes bacterium]
PSFYYTGIEEVGGQPVAPNLNLDYTKSLHTVVGYEVRFSNVLRINIEAYYQYLYDVPVQRDITKTGSMINVRDIWDAVNSGAAVNGGNGRNIGIDFTVEKNYSHNYYLLFTGSIFDSKYSTLAGDWYDTRFSSKYHGNFLAGKEWHVGKTGDKTFGLDLKFVLNGGERTTPIDLQASIMEGETVRYEDRVYSESVGTYYRIDIGVRYKVNRPKFSQTISLDIQNVTNHLNIQSDFYNANTGAVDYYYQTGLFPVLNYRVEF